VTKIHKGFELCWLFFLLKSLSVLLYKKSLAADNKNIKREENHKQKIYSS
jgi:hypothetical protein